MRWTFEQTAKALGISPNRLLDWQNGAMPAAPILRLERALSAITEGGEFTQLGRDPRTTTVKPKEIPAAASPPPPPPPDLAAAARAFLAAVPTPLLLNEIQRRTT